MRYLYLYITPQTRPRGINDLFVNIYRSYKYCQNVNRILLIDFTTTVYKCDLCKIFTFKQNDIICDSIKIHSIIDSCKDQIYPNKKVRDIVGLTKLTDWNHQLVNIHLSGWGCCKNNPIHKDNLKNNPEIVWDFIFSSIIIDLRIKKRCKKIIKGMPKEFSSIQIRNTDRESDALELLNKYQSKLFNTIYVATDHYETLNMLRETYQNYSFLNNTTFPDCYNTLHDSIIDGKTKITDILTDLYIISKSKGFYANSPGSFSKLCNFMYHNNKYIVNLIHGNRG